jgi:hypothetical protein
MVFRAQNGLFGEQKISNKGAIDNKSGISGPSNTRLAIRQHSILNGPDGRTTASASGGQPGSLPGASNIHQAKKGRGKEKESKTRFR